MEVRYQVVVPVNRNKEFPTELYHIFCHMWEASARPLIWFALRHPTESGFVSGDNGAAGSTYSSVHQFGVLVPSDKNTFQDLDELNFMPVAETLKLLRHLRTPPRWDDSILARMDQVMPDYYPHLKDSYRVFYPALTQSNPSVTVKAPQRIPEVVQTNINAHD